MNRTSILSPSTVAMVGGRTRCDGRRRRRRRRRGGRRRPRVRARARGERRAGASAVGGGKGGPGGGRGGPCFVCRVFFSWVASRVTKTAKFSFNEFRRTLSEV